MHYELLQSFHRVKFAGLDCRSFTTYSMARLMAIPRRMPSPPPKSVILALSTFYAQDDHGNPDFVFHEASIIMNVIVGVIVDAVNDSRKEIDEESNKSEVTLESIAKQLEELNRKLNG